MNGQNQTTFFLEQETCTVQLIFISSFSFKFWFNTLIYFFYFMTAGCLNYNFFCYFGLIILYNDC